VWRALPWVVAVGLLMLVERIIPLDETWATLRGLSWAQIGALVLLNGLILVLLNARWYFIARGQGYPVSFFALFGYRLAAFGVSYFTPGPHFGGEPLQIYLLQKRQGMPRSTAVAALVLDKSLELWVNFAFLVGGLMTLLFWGILPNLLESHFLIFALALLALPTGFLTAVWWGYSPMSRLVSWLHGRLGHRNWGVRWGRLWAWLPGAVTRTEGEITLFCQRRPLYLLAAFLVSVLSWLVVFVEYWFVLSLMGMTLTPLQVLTALVVLRATLFLPLPGGLGGVEAGQILILGLLGQSQAAALSAALLIRARDVLMGLLGLWWGWVVTPKRGKTADYAD
jgi:uncharacterized protein (TIRG00374 family)